MGKLLDFSKLGLFFEKKFNGRIYRISYYVAYPTEGTRPKNDIDKLHKFLTYLKKGLGYHIVKKPLKTIYLRNAEGKLIYDQIIDQPASIEKGNLDVEITIDAIRYSGTYDIAIFLTGDSDFLALINYLRNLDNPKKVFIFSTENCISVELRTGSDGYFDIRNFKELHGVKLLKKNK